MSDCEEMFVRDAAAILEHWVDRGTHKLRGDYVRRTAHEVYGALECALSALAEVRAILGRHQLPGEPIWLAGGPVDELIAEAIAATEAAYLVDGECFIPPETFGTAPKAAPDA